MVTFNPLTTISLTDPTQWSWKQSSKPALTSPDELISFESDSNWKPASQMPSLVHVELLAAGEILDPFLGLNEKLVQWIGEKDWLYKCCFELNESELSINKNAELVFEGLDTFATVYLNDRKIFSSDNMFISHRINVQQHLRIGTNTLIIVFTSAFIKGRVIEEEYIGKNNHLAAWNGDVSRLFVRKAAYHWGWDWGPVLNTCGVWKSIFLELYSARINEFSVKALVNEELECSLEISTSSTSTRIASFIRFSLLDSDDAIIRQSTTEVDDDTLNSDVLWRLKPGEVSLWWSVGKGAQPLYTVKVELLDVGGQVIMDTQSKRIGFRRLLVIQEPLIDEAGTTFRFEINNVAIFCGGSNWIPIDSFLTNANPQRYRKLLTLLVSGNQNMIRSWGGGIYENDCFFDICDELGILVWQDFAFACGQYPANYPGFIESIRAEAECNIKRIRHHSSIAIWAGNNEDYQVAESLGLEYDPEDKDGDWLKTNFPARQIYERELPEIVNRLTDTYYHPGSPWGGKNSRDSTIGDVHEWNVWHGAQLSYQDYDKLGGRFVSEFGMQGFPDSKTVDYFLNGNKPDCYPQSETIAAHNKATGYERRIELYLIENIQHTFEMNDYIYSTQFIQAEALSTAYYSWRRRFQGPGRYYVSGALVWQLNDVFPCVSWSIIDYLVRPKPAYFAIKRALADVSVGMKRFVEREFETDHSALFSETEFVEIWVANSTLEVNHFKVIIEAFTLKEGLLVYSESFSTNIEANRSSEIRRMKLPISIKKDSVVVSTRLLHSTTDEVISRFLTFPEPYKYLEFPSAEETGLEFNLDKSLESLSIRSQRPLKGLILSFSTDVTLEDNCLDLIPGEQRSISLLGLTETTIIKWRHLGGSGQVEK